MRFPAAWTSYPALRRRAAAKLWKRWSILDSMLPDEIVSEFYQRLDETHPAPAQTVYFDSIVATQASRWVQRHSRIDSIDSDHESSGPSVSGRVADADTEARIICRICALGVPPLDRVFGLVSFVFAGAPPRDLEAAFGSTPIHRLPAVVEDGIESTPVLRESLTQLGQELRIVYGSLCLRAIPTSDEPARYWAKRQSRAIRRIRAVGGDLKALAL